MTHNELGLLGEDLATDFLIRSGFNIIERNWRSDHLEIDIIAKNLAITHFIEVKTRSLKHIKPFDQYLSFSKLINFQRAVEAYIDQHNCDLFQLDLIVINYSVNTHTLVFKEELYVP